MTDFIFIISAVAGWFLGMFFVTSYLKRSINNLDQSYETIKNDCSKSHSWAEYETAPGSGLVYLKCKDCKKTLKQVLDG